MIGQVSIFSSKRALSPLVATLVLVVFALIVGTMTMSWGKSYVDTIADEEPAQVEPRVIDSSQANTPLKRLQLDYIEGKISEDEYLARQKQLTGR